MRTDEHRTDWRRLSIRTDDGIEAEALGWWPGYGGTWVLDRVVDGDALAYAHEVTDLGPADVLVLPAPSGPVVKHTWGWECGNVEATDLADADGWVAELPQHIADSRAIAAHIRWLGEVVEVPEPQVWLDSQPLVPRPIRVWRAGSPEPKQDVRAVLDADGDVWQRRQGGWPWVLNDEVPMTWDELLHTYGPVVEVVLPTAVTE